MLLGTSMSETQKPFSPIVADGSELSDIYAGKVVDAWLNRVQAAENDFLERMKAFIRQNGIGGNPKAQRKFVERFTKSVGDMVLQSNVVPASRAKYTISFDLLQTGGVIDKEGWQGEARWLYLSRMIIKGKGPTADPDFSDLTVAGVSRHALIRLIQRGGLERAEDFVALMKSARHILTLMEFVGRKMSLPTSLLIPVVTPNGLGALIAEAPDRALVAKTFVGADMLSETQAIACRTHYDYAEGLVIGSITSDDLMKLVDVIRETAKTVSQYPAVVSSGL